MKVVVAMDSFKGSMSSLEAGTQVEKAIAGLDPDAEVVVLPLADGGEGTMHALISGMGGELVEIEVSGPLGTKVRSRYGITSGHTAIIEMAECSGLTLVPDELRDPLKTNTYGLGELILDAAERGCRNFIIGIGGSATNDLGTGMLAALGVRFYGEDGGEIIPCGGNLGQIKKLDMTAMDPRMEQCGFRVACDVSNPLLGASGCARVFSPQKGALLEAVELLEQNAQSFSAIVSECTGRDMSDIPGAGAAGGLGYGFLSFLPARLEPGVDIVLDEIKIDEIISDADIVITGEGRIDGQSAFGKAPIGIASRAKKYGALTLGLCGGIGNGAELCNEYGLDAFFSIVPAPCSMEQAMERETAEENLRLTAAQIFRLIKCCGK